MKKKISKNRKIVYISYMSFIEILGLVLYILYPNSLSLTIIVGMNLCAILFVIVDYSENCEEVMSIGV